MEDKYKFIIFIVVIVLGGIYFYNTKPLTKDECYRLGSNERMYACLAEVAQRNPTQDLFLPENQLNQLSLNGGDMKGNSYYNQNPTYSATLQNKTGQTLYDVTVRFKFYKSSGTCNDVSDDTQYVNVAPVIYAGDSKAISTIVETPFNTSGSFKWCAEVVQAKLTEN